MSRLWLIADTSRHIPSTIPYKFNHSVHSPVLLRQRWHQYKLSFHLQLEPCALSPLSQKWNHQSSSPSSSFQNSQNPYQWIRLEYPKAGLKISSVRFSSTASNNDFIWGSWTSGGWPRFCLHPRPFQSLPKPSRTCNRWQRTLQGWSGWPSPWL